MLVIVTVHGIGFEQPPEGDQRGYADGLHARLKRELTTLGDDPNRPEGGPVYARSEWNGSAEKGLERLKGPLAPPGEIAHVALVYAPPEDTKPRILPVLLTVLRAILSFKRYATAVGLVRMLARDLWAMLRTRRPAQPPPAADGQPQPLGLRPRVDPHDPYAPRHGGQPAYDKPPTLAETVKALMLDVATYIELNEERERVRRFVQAALLTLLDRTDVERIVVNAHSQGTVVCWDVLCRLPFFSWEHGDPRAGKLCQLVTAGSPIRKYIDLFAWGQLVGELAALLRQPAPRAVWRNFWDPRDPVADPLDPAMAWRPGRDPQAGRDQDIGLLIARDPSGAPDWHVTVHDTKVDNVANSEGGGLRAHDYWNNQSEFVKALAEITSGCD